MATITLYKDKINGVGSLLDDIIKSSNNLNAQLGTLKNTLQGVDSSTCNLQNTVDSISSSSKSESDKVEDLKKLNGKLTDFIEMTTKRDSSAKSEIERAKEDFYTKYKYLKPECEKSRIEKIVDGMKKACEWCKEHWKEILIAIELVVAVVCLFVPGLQGVGTAILTHMLKGLIAGLVVGAVIGGISGYAQEGVSGILKGALSGAKDGALMGAAFGGLGGFGAGLGTIGQCSTAINILFGVSSTISVGMLSFDMLALGDMTLMRLSQDFGFNYNGGQIAAANAKAHSNPFYNGIQIVAGGVASFSGGYVKTAACFVAGTLVATINGFRAIEEIKQGDMVLSADENTLETDYKPVLETYVRQVDRLVHLTINGEEIISTEDHPFYVKGKGFVQAVMLWIGAEVINNGGDVLAIEEIYCETLHDELCKVYNFQVEDFHTYYVGTNCVLVHNAKYPRTELDNLENTDNFTEKSLKHIFDGEVNVRGKGTGYHYEGIEDSAGSVVDGTRTTPSSNGVYEGQVTVNGTPKTANGGKSTFFPESMMPQEVVDCINEAYGNKTLVEGTTNTYQGTSSSGIDVTMYIDGNGKIISAFPGGN